VRETIGFQEAKQRRLSGEVDHDLLLSDRTRRFVALGELDLEPETEQRLTKALGLSQAIFSLNGLDMTPAKEVPSPYKRLAKEVLPDNKDHAPHRIDFGPPEVGNDFHPDKRSYVIVAGLTALEDYIFLVREQLLPRPGAVYGFTNERLATFASRLGFKRRYSRWYGAWLMLTHFDNIETAVTSFDPARRRKLLDRRMRFGPDDQE
jgi:hypothetical protein